MTGTLRRIPTFRSSGSRAWEWSADADRPISGCGPRKRGGRCWLVCPHLENSCRRHRDLIRNLAAVSLPVSVVSLYVSFACRLRRLLALDYCSQLWLRDQDTKVLYIRYIPRTIRDILICWLIPIPWICSAADGVQGRGRHPLQPPPDWPRLRQRTCSVGVSSLHNSPVGLPTGGRAHRAAGPASDRRP